MKKTSLLVWVGLLSAAICTPNVLATTTTPILNQDSFSVGRGDVETNFAIQTQIFRGDLRSETFDLNLGGNYFITDMFAPGLDFQINHNGAGTSARVVPNLKAYWPTYSKFLPYAQVGFGYAHVPGDDGLAIGFGVGVNYLLSSSVTVGIKLAYEMLAGSGLVHQISLPIGFAIYFKI